VFSSKILIVECSTVDGVSTGTVTIGYIATLDDESGDDTVEFGILVGELCVGVLTGVIGGAETTEIL
jgi:hypothetical protein